MMLQLKSYIGQRYSQRGSLITSALTRSTIVYLEVLGWTGIEPQSRQAVSVFDANDCRIATEGEHAQASNLDCRTR